MGNKVWWFEKRCKKSRISEGCDREGLLRVMQDVKGSDGLPMMTDDARSDPSEVKVGLHVIFPAGFQRIPSPKTFCSWKAFGIPKNIHKFQLFASSFSTLLAISVAVPRGTPGCATRCRGTRGGWRQVALGVGASPHWGRRSCYRRDPRIAVRG